MSTVGHLLRSVVAAAAGVLAGLALIWAAFLYLAGGFDGRILGRDVTSHEPLRPLMVGGFALAVFMLAGGDSRVVRWIRRVAGLGPRLARFNRAGQLDIACAIVLALGAVAVGVVNGSRTAYGSDACGYLSEAELFHAGRVSVPQPWVKDVPWPNARWTFSPLGFTPSREPSRLRLGGYQPSVDEWAIVPTYSPGLPLLMALAKDVAGHRALFWIVPLSGGVLLLATYGLGVRFGSRRLGTMAAFLVATSPPFLEFQQATMTEVPVAAAWTLACWCLLGESLPSACGAALALAVAVLIRPNLVPLAGVIVLWMAMRVWYGGGDRGRQVTRGGIVLLGLAAGGAGTAAVYWITYGSPLESGYGPASGYFAWRYVLPNIRTYAQQFAETHTAVAYLGLAALFMPAKRLWPGVADRSNIAMAGLFVLVIWAEFCAFLPADAALRFLLPCYPFIMIGLSSVGLLAARSGWRGAAPGVAVAALAFGLLGVDLASRRGNFSQWRMAVVADVAEQVGRATPANSVVMAMQHSGSIRYYAGRVTLRWDELPVDWFDRGVAWMAERGVHTYMLVDGWELPLIRKRFAGQALTAVLDAPPVFSMGDTHLYDLGMPPGGDVRTAVIPPQPRRGWCPPPAPLPTLLWAPR